MISSLIKKGGTYMLTLNRIDQFRWELPPQGPMRVPGLIYANENGHTQGFEHASQGLTDQRIIVHKIDD